MNKYYTCPKCKNLTADYLYNCSICGMSEEGKQALEEEQ